MLETELGKAKLEHRQKYKQIIIGLSIILFLCLIIIYAISSFKIAPRKQAATIHQNVSLQPGSEPIDTGIDDGRETFIELLDEYNQNIEKQLENINFEHWNRAKYAELVQLKDSAINDFSQAKYRSAIDKITAVGELGRQLVDKSKQNHAIEFDKARQSYLADKYDEARHHIERSLIFDKNSAAGLELKKNIEDLPAILPLIKDANIARTENNIMKEFDLLNRILQINPQRQQLKIRRDELSKTIKQKSFEQRINLIRTAITNKNAAQAKKLLSEAKKTAPKRTELALLKKEIEAIEKTDRINKEINNFKLLATKDNWRQAKESIKKLLKDLPHDREALNNLETAEKILKYQDLFGEYITNPYRLANNRLNEKLQSAIDESGDIIDLSASLKTQREKMITIIEKMKKKIPVDISSDDKTYISVRGVGKVGMTKNKTIHMHPGPYTFEGRRDGYKSKLVKVMIELNQSRAAVSIICDEPIK